MHTVSSTADRNKVELTRFKQSISAMALAELKLTHVTDLIWKRELYEQIFVLKSQGQSHVKFRQKSCT